MDLKENYLCSNKQLVVINNHEINYNNILEVIKTRKLGLIFKTFLYVLIVHLNLFDNFFINYFIEFSVKQIFNFKIKLFFF